LLKPLPLKCRLSDIVMIFISDSGMKADIARGMNNKED
jgi:hypothetical protein